MLTKSVGVLIAVAICSITIPILIINKKAVCSHEYWEEAKAKSKIENLKICVKEGNVDAAILLSKLYVKGYLIEKNHYKAIETVKKFAHEGNEKAMIQIADLNSCYGPEYNNFDEAEKWYKKAVNNYDGCSVEAPLALAKFYKRKYDYTGDPNSGAAYITHLYKMGLLGNVDAMHLLASEYQNGGIFQQDYHKALEWLKKAAETGDIRAHRTIGNYYVNGYFGDADYEQAAYWFQKAAEMGDRVSSEFLKNNPSPLGLEITKATVSDFKKKFKIHNKLNIPNFINGGDTYLVDPKYIPLPGVQEIAFVFNKNSVLEAVLMFFNKSDFIEILYDLKSKYALFIGGPPNTFEQGFTKINLKDHYVFYSELNTVHNINNVIYHSTLCTLMYTSRAFELKIFERDRAIIKIRDDIKKRKRDLF